MTADHATISAYQRGCRCEACTLAQREYHNAYSHRYSFATDCAHHADMGKASTSRCIQISQDLVRTDAEVRRIGKLASRSEQAFARYASQLRLAKEQRTRARQDRDEHAAECDAAAERWSA